MKVLMLSLAPPKLTNSFASSIFWFKKDLKTICVPMGQRGATVLVSTVLDYQLLGDNYFNTNDTLVYK